MSAYSIWVMCVFFRDGMVAFSEPDVAYNVHFDIEKGLLSIGGSLFFDESV